MSLCPQYWRFGRREGDVLTRLAKFIRFAGRYPIAKNPEDMAPRETVGLGKIDIGFFSKADFRTSLSILNKLMSLISGKNDEPFSLSAVSIIFFARRRPARSLVFQLDGKRRSYPIHAVRITRSDSIRGCQAPGFVQRAAANPARSGRKQR